MRIRHAILSAVVAVSISALVRCGPGEGNSGVDAGPKIITDAGTNVGSDAGTDAGPNAGTDAGTDAGPVVELLVSNSPIRNNCTDRYAVAPSLPSEAGHWTSSWLVPSAYPFQVKRVAYELPNEGKCRTEIPHKVRLYVVTAQTIFSDGGMVRTAPPSTPTLNNQTAVEINVPNSDGGTDLFASNGTLRGREISLTLPAPITLLDGQALFVSIQLNAQFELQADGGGILSDGGLPLNTAVCMDACFIDLADGGVINANPVGLDYWSNAAAEPYSWADMVSDFGFPGLFTTRAYGTQP